MTFVQLCAAEGGPMITFRCTKKLRDLLGLTDRDLDDESEGDLYEWFVETATIER